MNNLKIFWFFWHHIKPYKWYYLIMLLAPLYGGFFQFIYNYSIKLIIDNMVETPKVSYENLLFPISLFLGANLLLDVFWRISSIAEWRSEPYVRRSIILHSYDYVQNHSVKFFQNNFVGAISSKLKGILDGYDKFWAEMHHGFLTKILSAVINIFALGIVNLRLGFFMIVWCIAYCGIIYRLSIKLNQRAFDETESRHMIFGQIADRISNIFSIFSFAAKKRELFAIKSQIEDDFIPKQIRLYKTSFVISVVAGVLYMGMFTFLILYMVHLRMKDLVSIGDFALVFGLSALVAESIWQVTQSLQDFTRAMGDLNSSLSVLRLPLEDVDKAGALKLKVNTPSISFLKVNFSYSLEQKLFSDLCLFIKPGEKIGLVGHTGAGKSTLINLLLRYFKPNSGRILIDSTDISNVTKESLWSNIAVIPQDVQLFHRSIYENIAFGRASATQEEVIKASKIAHIHNFIQSLPQGYDTLVGERGVKLSGGQRQRISIARAILKDAPILVLDEATSSLDSHTEKQIQQSLDYIMSSNEKTVLAIAHRLSTLKSLDRIVVIDQGRIIEQGTHHDLMSQEHSLYRKLWKLQEV